MENKGILEEEKITVAKIEIHIEDERGTIPIGFFSDGEMAWNGGSMVYSEYVKTAIREEVRRRIGNGQVQDNLIILPGYIGLRGRALEQYRILHGLQMYYTKKFDPEPPTENWYADLLEEWKKLEQEKRDWLAPRHIETGEDYDIHGGEE